MAFVSKKTLPKKVQDRLDQQFIKSIVSLKTFSGGERFLSELFSETEQIMLSKRLMIIFLLSQNISQYRIKKLLQVSSSTVMRMALGVEQGAYSDVVRFCDNRKHRKGLLLDLEVVVRAGMPEMGKGRWKWLDELYER